MIRQDTVIAVTPIALEMASKNFDLESKIGAIVEDMNSVSGSLLGYSENDVAVELPANTEQTTEHTEAIEMMTDKLAEIIRGSLYTISKYVKPAMVEADQSIRNVLDPRSAIDVAMDVLHIDMVNLQPAFLSSVFCPTELPAMFRGNNIVDIKFLLRGNYPSDVTGEELRELIGVDHDIIAPFLEDGEEILNVYRQLFVGKNWYGVLPMINGADDGIVNISNRAHYRFSTYRALVIANLLVNKLCVMDDPFPGVTGVSGVDYKTSLASTRDTLSAMLFYFRQIWAQEAKAGLVIMDSNVKYGTSTYSCLNGAAVLSGTVSVGYNDEVLEMFANNDTTSISEHVMGYLYAKQRGYQIKDIMTDAAVIRDAFVEYQGDIRTAIQTNSRTAARNAFYEAMKRVEKTAAFEGMINTLDNNVPVGLRMLTELSKAVDFDMFFNDNLMVERIVRGDTLMRTQLAVSLCRVFGSEIAAEILTTNAQAEPGTVEHQKKILTHGNVYSIVKRLLK